MEVFLALELELATGSVCVDYLGIAAKNAGNNGVSVRNIVIDRYSVIGLRRSPFPHLYSEGKGPLLRGVTVLCFRETPSLAPRYARQPATRQRPQNA